MRAEVFIIIGMLDGLVLQVVLVMFAVIAFAVSFFVYLGEKVQRISLWLILGIVPAAITAAACYFIFVFS